MATLDTLEILIEADAKGLETQLKRATDKVSGFVDKLNGEDVNWQKILAGSLDTAIISGVASMFAVAISQALNFQDSLLNVSNNAGSTGDSLGSLNDSIVSLAGQTGASVSDTTAAYESLYKQFGDAATAQTLTAEAGKLALASNESLSDLMPTLIKLFNQWGISSLPAAQDALTGLVNAAGQGKFTLSELINTITGQGTTLQGKTTISEMAIDMQALSTQTGLTKDTIVSGFNTIATGVANPLSNISLLVRGVTEDISGPGGLIKAFADVSGTISGFGDAGVTMAQQMGFSAGEAVNFGDQTKASFDKASTAADTMRANLSPLDQILETNMSDIDHFRQAYENLLATLAKDVGLPLLDHLTNAFKDINSLLSGQVSLKDFFEAVPSGVGKVSNSLVAASGKTALGGVDILAELGKALQGGVLGGLNAGKDIVNSLGAGNNPSPSSTQNNMRNVTVNITNNLSGGGNPASHQIMGQSIGEKAYNAFMGLLSDI